MSKFTEYRIHFDIHKKTGHIVAHSDPISVDQIEEYIKVFGCGRATSSTSGRFLGALIWQADSVGGDNGHGKRLAQEWLADPISSVYPAKAARLQRMVDEDNQN